MEDAVFEAIINNIMRSGFSGRIVLSLNNEPLLDSKLSGHIAMCRRMGFAGNLSIISNGILLSESLAAEIFEAGLDCITVNSYSETADKLVGKIGDWLSVSYPFDEKFPGKRMSVNFRFKNEVLTNRAGSAPNKPRGQLRKASCFWPFCVLPITTDGSVFLCCNDFYCTTAFGNIAYTPLRELWNSDFLLNARKSLALAERKNISLCSQCDFKGYLNPAPVWYARMLGI
jgi:MoaA/NifB/PqqE/SkfB family radical SAM enzyme